MKILLKGFGSIGKRHVTNLLHLGYKDISIVSSKSQLGNGFENLNHYTTLEDAINENQFSHGFICSPTSIHFDDLNAFLDAGIKNIYLEKPISHNLDGLEKIVEKLAGKEFRIQVGFDLHFDPGLVKAKDILDSGLLGKIFSANAFVGQYLPDWRPHEDYKKGMSASKEKGGGVLLDLVHEFDYLRWIMGTPNFISAFYQNNNCLGIETEDLADVLIKFESGANSTIHLDYHQRKLTRFCIFTGELGSLKWDLISRTLTLTGADFPDQVFDFSSFERNDRYVEIMRTFIQTPTDWRLTNFEEGLISLKMVLCAKSSSDSTSMIDFKKI